jgi:hypothetical protein
VHFREILSGYFLFSRFDWSIFVTQLVAKHMKEIIIIIEIHTGVSEIRVLILTIGRTRQIMELFSITFLRKSNTN